MTSSYDILNIIIIIYLREFYFKIYIKKIRAFFKITK